MDITATRQKLLGSHQVSRPGLAWTIKQRNSLLESEASPIQLRVATLEVVQATCRSVEPGVFECEIVANCKNGEGVTIARRGPSQKEAVAEVISGFCFKPIEITSTKITEHDAEQVQVVVAVAENGDNSLRAGVGRYVSQNPDTGLIVAALRAASHAGLLKSAFRANNQKVFRGWSQDLMEELLEALDLEAIDSLKRLEAEGLVLEHMNRVASAAVVTAANYPKPDSILSLFDTSAWLFDRQGQRRDSYTDTSLWLAWYPGIENDDLTADEVINSMPAAPESAIPWIVRLFENPESWIRFRGAVDLEDHDMMHVLLGRGLQDQDEAFVIGFAMGTAKRISWFEYWVFKFVLARLYPEPYRIPKFLQPAFNLGVKCGKETGSRNLYRRQLKEWRHLPLGEARERAEIDMQVVRKYYEQEQQQIPFTIASLRLP